MNTTLWQNNYDDVCAYLSEHSCDLNEITKKAVFSNGKNMYRRLVEMKKACEGKSKYKLGREQKKMLKVCSNKSLQGQKDVI